MLVRERYLCKIRKFYDNELIKVLIGMRRTGKSTLMRQIIDELKENNIKEENIIYINFESIMFEGIKEYMKLYEYIENKVLSTEKYYIFIDEIQLVDMFEKTINSLNVDFNVSIFITGSNSNLLSGELATLLSGRYIQTEVLPFSFNEWLEVTNSDSNDENLMKYLIYGGLPQVALLSDDEQRISVLSDILNSIVYKDIIARSKVTNYGLLEKLIDYIVMNTSEILSISSITKYLKSIGEVAKADTIYTYISHIKNSFLVKECKKYDLKGKKLLSIMNKFYVNDLGLRRVVLNSENIEFSKVVETAVFNHLKALGYKINYLRIGELEIDFYVTKVVPGGSKNKYIQVSHLMSEEATIEREFKPFTKLKDGYDRVIITQDTVDMSRDGVKHVRLLDFLRNDDF